MWSSILIFCPLYKLFSWGQNGSGQLGIGTTYQNVQPCMVPFFNIFVKKVNIYYNDYIKLKNSHVNNYYRTIKNITNKR